MPTAEEIHQILDECDISPDLLSDATTMSPRTEAIATKNALKVVLDYPIVKRTDINHPHEVKYIATKKYLVTIRFEEIEALDRFAKDFEVHQVLDKKRTGVHAGHVLFSLLQHMYAALDKKLDYLESRVTEVEQDIFAEREREMVFEISKISRRLINFKQTLLSHEPAIDDLHDLAHIPFGKKFAANTHELHEYYGHLLQRVNRLTNTLTELRETNMGLLTTKQNEIMKNLTIMAFITFPLTLFSSVFGMNTVETPIAGVENDFWIITGIMLVVSISFFIYFYFKKWL